jgi:integrase/recombinase XerC
MSADAAGGDAPDRLPAVIPPGPAPPARLGAADLLTAFLAGLNPHTRDAYARDLARFAAFAGAPSAHAAVESFLSLEPGEANLVTLRWRARMKEVDGLAPATIARRLASLRSLVKLARTLGRIRWALDVPSPKVEAYRDTRGPGQSGWRDLYGRAKAGAATGRGAAVRDLALLLLLRDHALRRAVAVGLDLADLEVDDPEAPGCWIVGKGKTQRSRITLNRRTVAALREWLAYRGTEPGPLFFRLDKAAAPDGSRTRLTGRSVGRLVLAAGRRAGLFGSVRPHGLRHEGITRALDLAGGDVRKVQRFSRHARLETLMRYDDNRRDDAGAIARLLGEDGDE